MDRRAFFLSLFTGGWELYDEARGRPNYRMEDIPLLPEAEIARMAPVVHRDVTLMVQDGWLSVARGRQGATLTPLEPMTELRAFILGLFDGRHAIADIGAEAAGRFGLPPGEAEGEARAFFIALAAKGVCHPMDEPRDE